MRRGDQPTSRYDRHSWYMLAGFAVFGLLAGSKSCMPEVPDNEPYTNVCNRPTGQLGC